MLTIKNKKPQDIKVAVWDKISGFDPFKDEKFDLQGTIERIADVYGLTADEVAEELAVSDVLPCYLDCVKFVNGLVLSKLGKLSGGKKKAD